MRSKADTTQLNLPHETKEWNKKIKIRTGMLRSIDSSPGVHGVSSEEEKEDIKPI